MSVMIHFHLMKLIFRHFFDKNNNEVFRIEEDKKTDFELSYPDGYTEQIQEYDPSGFIYQDSFTVYENNLKTIYYKLFLIHSCFGSIVQLLFILICFKLILLNLLVKKGKKNVSMSINPLTHKKYYLNFLLRAASDFFLRLTLGFS